MLWMAGRGATVGVWVGIGVLVAGWALGVWVGEGDSVEVCVGRGAGYCENVTTGSGFVGAAGISDVVWAQPDRPNSRASQRIQIR